MRFLFLGALMVGEEPPPAAAPLLEASEDVVAGGGGGGGAPFRLDAEVESMVVFLAGVRN